MSLNNNEFEVKMVRIKPLDNSDIITYDNNVKVSVLSDIQRRLTYLRIVSDEKSVYRQEFNSLKWLPESSTNGVATISSSTVRIVIIYDAKNEILCNFFTNLQTSLEHESRPLSSTSIPPQPNQDQVDSMIDDLIRSINTSSLNDATCIAQKLAELKVDIQFSLFNKIDNQNNKISESKQDDNVKKSLNSVLQLILRIECHLTEDAIIAPINVRCGTTLQSLKHQIETATGVRCANQYWYAFERYPISDDYVFGSSVSVISNKQQQQQQHSLNDYIRSGDTLIMTGQVSNITIRRDDRPDDIRRFTTAKVQLISNESNSEVVIKVPPDDQIVYRFYLKDCNYVNESSLAGRVECIHINSTSQTLVILHDNVDVMQSIRDYFTRKVPHHDDSLINNEKVNQLIKALSESKADEAARIARQLAQENVPIRFNLDMINESGNVQPRKPPEPTIQPLKLKLSIETFLIDQCTDEQYDIAILPETTIQELKQLVYRNTQINPNQQYWYINREHLPDAYKFGITPPRVNENTVLTLFITKPPNN